MIHLTGLTVSIGARVLYQNASLQLRTGDKCGLVGPNGAGKTTVFRIITKQREPDAGDVSIPNRCVVGYFSQDVGEMRGNSILDEVKKASRRIDELGRFVAECEERMARLEEEPLSDDDLATMLERYGEAQEEFERRGGYNRDHIAQEILTGLGIAPSLHHDDVGTLSGGWKMRVELAKILMMKPDVLLMDEPTNHLDVESIVWLEQWLQAYKGCLLMTSHDREFMNRIVTRIFEVDNKAITSYSGNYDFYEKDREIRLEQLVASFKRQQEMLAKEEEFIARFAARASHAAQVNSRVKKIEKIERIEIPKESKVIRFEFAPPPRSGDDVVIFENLGKQWTRKDGSEHQVFSNVTAVVSRQSRVGVVGFNGAGKSTLLKLIIGQAEPTEGKVRTGANVDIGYFSQYSLDLLNPNHTVFDSVREVLPVASVGVVKSLLGAFLFSGDDVEKKISVLSGGEKSRVLLARILARPVNLLVLDEPTNHLDMKSREVLLDALQRFAGTIIIVSHDRYFQKALVNRVFEIDSGHLRIYEGRYDEYLQKCEAEQREHFMQAGI
jgi:ATP-binding cassette subfamily F protein 3